MELGKSQLNLGDRVGFLDTQNNDLYGEVIRLNQKTATVMLADQTEWRGPYQLLSFVIEGERIDTRLIEDQVLNRK